MRFHGGTGMPLFDDSTWRREEWYEPDELSQPYFAPSDGLIDAVIYVGRATGVVPAVWLFLLFTVIAYIVCLGFEIAVAVRFGHDMFSEAAIYFIPPIFAFLITLAFDRKALWRRRD